MPHSHPMMPEANHDEAAEQLFVRDFKQYLSGAIEADLGQAAAALDPGPASNDRDEEVYRRLHDSDAFRSWASLRRTSQELLWDAIDRSVDRQAEALDSLAEAAPPLGALTLDPDMIPPPYLVDADVHLMPGGYMRDGGGVAQGAIMDRGGAVYMLGRNGGLMNDMRGHSLVAHLFARFPEARPVKILELGCGVGTSLCAVASHFPEAEVSGIDVGGSMLRYAHARAAHLGHAIHFIQADAEHTKLPSDSYDLVFSAALFHETSDAAIGRIVAESLRLLRPGGVAIHLEVPQRYEAMDRWNRVRGRIEHDFNNEPAWKEAISADYSLALDIAGFVDVAVGYQDSTATPTRAGGGFSDTSKGVFRSWFVASGRKPEA
jgi:ubiquinone/menaquinone biosynthesis C-methylase UbiE